MDDRPAQPQSVLAPPAKAAIFLVLEVHRGAEAEVQDLLTDLAGLTRAVAFRSPEDRLSCVAGIGANFWDRTYGLPRPAALHPFRELTGAVHRALGTPGDLLFHLRADRMDLCFELGRQLMVQLGPHADVVDEVHGFRYFDERDLLGFVDGTENPSGAAAEAAVHIGSEDPAFAGGSYVVVQKYLHRLDAWDSLPVEEQERVIGRHKLSDVELPDPMQPSSSHVALNTIVDADGSERKIVRDNMVFGSIGAGEFGTYFIGYAASSGVIEQMLENMFVGSPPGNYDRILDFSTVVTGGLFFVPTVDFLEGATFAPPGSAVATSDAAGPGATPPDAGEPDAGEPDITEPRADGSLSIGSLKGSATP